MSTSTRITRNSLVRGLNVKRFALLGTLLGLFGLSSAFAQDISIGATFGVGFFPFNTQTPDVSNVDLTPTAVGGQITAHRLIDIIGVRGNVEMGLDESYFEAGGDLLLTFRLGNVHPYLGAGVGTRFEDPMRFKARGVIGLELLVMNSFGLFTELDPTLRFADFPTFEAKLRAGANIPLLGASYETFTGTLS